MSRKDSPFETDAAAWEPQLPDPRERQLQGPVMEMLSAAAEGVPDRTALVYREETTTYAELLEHAERLADGLTSIGLGPGDPVALLLANGPPFVLSFFAIARLAAVVVPLNPQFKEAELEFYFRECGIRAVIADPESVDVSRRILDRLDQRVELVTTGEPDRDLISFASLIDRGSRTVLESRSPNDDFVFQYSSGSTGRPKRVPRTQAQLRSEAESFFRTTRMTEADTIFCSVPLFHSYGMGCCLVAAIRSAATLVVLEEPQPLVLARDRALRLLEREQVTVFPGVPFTFRLLAEAPVDADLSRLRLCFSAGNALPRSTFEAFKRKFGVPIRQLYGLTETGAVTANLDENPEPTALSVGHPFEPIRLRIVDESGGSLEPGRIGEIAISSPGAMHGYASMEELNRHAFHDGYFLTGDRGRLDDDGRLYITGRKKLLIDVKGDKVDPIEVEDVLATHPKVGEVVVVGVESSIEGEEVIKAVVVPERPCEDRELIRFCRERLANYKVPQIVEFRDEIPKSSMGKVLRKYLVE